MAFHPRPVPPLETSTGFSSWSESIEVCTSAAPEFVDLTERVERIVARSGVSDGMAVVFSRHTTAAVVINESEPLLLEDMAEFLERMAPRAAAYRHNDFTVRTVNMTADESPNGHAHCLQLVLGASQTVPIRDGRMMLGRWQRVFLVELDHARPREAIVQAFGLTSTVSAPTPVGIARNGARGSTRI